MTRALFFLSGLLAFSELARVWWLNPSEKHWETVPVPSLDISAMEGVAGFSSLPVEDNVETGPLKFDHAAYLQGTHEEGDPLAVLFFSYRSNNRNLWTDLFTHPPEVCMRSSGCALESTPPARSLTLGSHSVPVRILKYRDPANRRPLYILKAVWLPPGSPIQAGDDMADLRALWVDMALHRIPHPPGAVLLTAIWGVEREDVAWDLFLNRVGKHLRLGEGA